MAAAPLGRAKNVQEEINFILEREYEDRTQIKLIADMEKKWDTMNEVVARLSAR